jgi:hypothetical protein
MNNKTQTWKRTLFAIGVSLCLAGALLMVHGSIFGDRTTGIAIVTGILGIGLISAYITKPTLKSAMKQEKAINSTERCHP